MCEWVNLAAEYLEPIYKLIARELRESPVGVLYDWHNNRKNTCLDSILLDDEHRFKGIIQCDGYEAYNTWAKKHNEVDLAGCWVHAHCKSSTT